MLYFPIAERRLKAGALALKSESTLNPWLTPEFSHRP
jgi:hypothetical protein